MEQNFCLPNVAGIFLALSYNRTFPKFADFAHTLNAHAVSSRAEQIGFKISIKVVGRLQLWVPAVLLEAHSLSLELHHKPIFRVGVIVHSGASRM